MIQINKLNITETTDVRYKLQLAARSAGVMLTMYSANLCQKDLEPEKVADQIISSCEKLLKTVNQIKEEINQENHGEK